MTKKRVPTMVLAITVLGVFLLAGCGTPSRNQRLTIEVTTPSTRGTVSEGETLVSGVVSDRSATLTINGQTVALSTDGAFSHTIPLNYGANRISIRAEKEGVTPATRSLTVTRALSLSIATPEEMTETTGTSITVSGSVSDPAAMITVTGTRISVDETGSFSVDVPLYYTETLIRVNAYVTDNVSATETLTVVRPEA